MRKERELAASWEELLRRNQYRSSTPPKGAVLQPPAVTVSTTLLVIPRRHRETPHYPSITSAGPVSLGHSVETPRYSEEMQRREEAAQQSIRKKKARTAPVYNKGGSQYFTEEMAKEMSTGSLRRRP